MFCQGKNSFSLLSVSSEQINLQDENYFMPSAMIVHVTHHLSVLHAAWHALHLTCTCAKIILSLTVNAGSGKIEEETEPTMKTAPTMATGCQPPRGTKSGELAVASLSQAAVVISFVASICNCLVAVSTRIEVIKMFSTLFQPPANAPGPYEVQLALMFWHWIQKQGGPAFASYICGWFNLQHLSKKYLCMCVQHCSLIKH